MNLNVGSVINSAMTIGSAIPDSTNDIGKANLKSFLDAFTKYGAQVKSNFEVVYDGVTGLQFFIQTITTPGLKSNNGQVYYKGRVVDVPVNYEQEHEIQMTVINDASGFIYQTMRKIMICDYEARMVKNNYKMVVRAVGDQQNHTGSVITMEGIRFTNVSGLDFGHNANEIQTFNVNCQIATMQIQQSHKKHEDGLLDTINNVTNKVDSAVGKVFGV